jgi:hypothetical protein
MIVPACTFFIPHDLWWNGRDGYRFVGGRTVFLTPSVFKEADYGYYYGY